MAQISQDTFDQVVKENMDDFGMELEEAQKDAWEQFETQGVDLSNIRRAGAVTEDHQVVRNVDELKKVVASYESHEHIDAMLENALREGLTALSAEIGRDEENRTIAGDREGVQTMIRALEAIANKPEIVKEALPGLLECLEDVENRSRLGAKGVVTLVKVLRANLDNPRAVKAVRLAITANEQNRRDAIDNGLIGVALDVLREHGTAEVIICRSACSLLRQIVKDDATDQMGFSNAHENARSVASDGALPLLIRLLEHWSGNGDVTADLFSCLGRLAIRAEFVDEIMENGGLDRTIRVLAENVKTPSLARQCCLVLRALAGSDDVKVEIRARGGLELLTTCLQANAGHAKVEEEVIGCIGAVCLRNVENVRAVAAADGIPILVDVMRSHPNEHRLQRLACVLVRNMVVRTEELKPLFLAEGVESLIRDAQKLSPSCEEAGKDALRDLGCKMTFVERWTGMTPEMQAMEDRHKKLESGEIL